MVGQSRQTLSFVFHEIRLVILFMQNCVGVANMPAERQYLPPKRRCYHSLSCHCVRLFAPTNAMHLTIFSSYTSVAHGFRWGGKNDKSGITRNKRSRCSGRATDRLWFFCTFKQLNRSDSEPSGVNYRLIQMNRTVQYVHPPHTPQLIS